ncbi:unnamed protein product, partial [Discosporangium mesarthrocarpum]
GGEAGAWRVAVSRRFHGGGDKSIVRIRLSGEGVSAGLGIGGMIPDESLTLWILYSDRVVVCMSAESLMALSSAQSPIQGGGELHSPGSSPKSPMASDSGVATPYFAKLQLEGQAEVTDVVACPATLGIFEARPERRTDLLLASGVGPALALYPIGPEVRSVGLVSLAWAVASRVTALTTGAIGGIFDLVGL